MPGVGGALVCEFARGLDVQLSNISGSTSICTLSNFQSETIAFRQNKNAPPVQSEGALYQNKRF